MYFKNIVAVLTAAALCLPTVAVAQPADPGTGKVSAAAPAGEKTANLKIIVLQGEGAMNNVQTHTATAPVVEVHDRNDQPVDGATVLFELPRTGAGGSFPAAQLAFTGQTNRRGQVGTPGFLPNHEAGRFNINVTANLGNSVGYAKIRQTNSERVSVGETTRAHKSKTWKVLAVVAAAAAVGGIVLATHGHSNTTATPTTVTLTPGPIGFGAPH
jgi:hypothetical protein